jgi:hypothetical protein
VLNPLWIHVLKTGPIEQISRNFTQIPKMFDFSWLDQNAPWTLTFIISYFHYAITWTIFSANLENFFNILNITWKWIKTDIMILLNTLDTYFNAKMGKPRNVIDINYHIGNCLQREEIHKEQTHEKPSIKWIFTHDGFSASAWVEVHDKVNIMHCSSKIYHKLNQLFKSTNFLNLGSLIFST